MKVRTTINIDDDLLESVKSTGVRNFSKYLERLIEEDLARLAKVGKTEQKRVTVLREDLEEIRDEWQEYKTKVSDSA